MIDVLSYIVLFFFFFFQAEDGIRDDLVTGVQTCALPISCLLASSNYVLNEILDARTDREHPVKRRRPIPSGRVRIPDRKSTRLNFSHQIISYAVFCLKKKKNTTDHNTHKLTHPDSDYIIA